MSVGAWCPCSLYLKGNYIISKTMDVGLVGHKISVEKVKIKPNCDGFMYYSNKVFSKSKLECFELLLCYVLHRLHLLCFIIYVLSDYCGTAICVSF